MTVDDTPNMGEQPNLKYPGVPDYEYYQAAFPEPANWDSVCNIPCNVVVWDDVEKPYHYNQRSMECIDWIEVGTEGLEGSEAYCIGAALKYLWRYKNKGGDTDLKKAIWYIKRCVSDKQKM